MERVSVIKTWINRKGEKLERKMTLDVETWRRMQKRPETFGIIGRVNPTKNIKFEKVKPVEKKPVEDYKESDYKTDLESGNTFFKEGELSKALECYIRAYEFKKSPYLKGKINKCNG